MRATIDTSLCQGHGMCYGTAPDVYEDDEEGYGKVRNGGEVPPELVAAARIGAANCPERAITLTE